jgi:hypothetical protein
MGLSEDDKALCDLMRENLNDSYQNSNFFLQNKGIESVALAFTKGDVFREEFLEATNELHPWLLEAPLEDTTQSDYIRANVWQIATAGTPLEYEMTGAQKERLLSEDDLSVDEFIDVLHMDVLSSETNETGCYAADQLRIEEANDSNLQTTYQAFLRTESLLETVAEQLIVIRGCKMSGSYVGSACVKDDLKSSPSKDIDTCDQKLSITENTANYGDCGKLTFTVFQADLNTGDYRALAWWTDKNGNRQLGMFMIGGLEEGSTYTMSVSVGRETTYTNELGAEKTVVTFLEQ